jgi:hypothetical protein
MNATKTTLTANEMVARGELLFSRLHGRFVRFVRWDMSDAVVCDRNTMVELPDYVHATQLERC